MNIILGTAGHIDHGKSSLIKVLSGTDPDRLPEEKSRGVTIELGFAHLTLENFEIGLIDVPGHADFINNMVSGVGALDIALFIVAADDGWMPQSEEHLQILNYLGIDNVIIALTKSDLAEDLEFTIELVREEILGTSIEDAPIIPVSSITGAGIDTLKTEILSRAKNLQAAPKHHIPRLSVDRAFSPKGTGTVITGTLTGQALRKGDTLTCLPEHISATIRNVQNHNKSLDASVSGMRTALNLPDLPLKQRGKPGVSRGSLLTLPDHLSPVDTLDVKLQREGRPITGQSATTRALKNTETVILHHGTSRTRARVVLLDRSTLELGDQCFAQLRLESPIAACTGDRFVIRDGGQQGTLGGGTIIDADAKARGFRTEERTQFLTLRAEAPDTLRPLILSELSKKPALNIHSPLTNIPFTKDFTQQTIEKLAKEKKVTLRADWLLAPPWWKEITQTAGTIIDQWHASNTDSPSMPIGTWRTQLLAAGAPEGLLDAIEKQLINNGYTKQKDGIANEDHSLELPDRLAPYASQILKTFQTHGLTPPPRVEIAPDDPSKQALTFLIRSGQIIELDPKALLDAAHFQKLRQSIIDYLSTHTRATASELREQSGASRKFIMPLLESLDEEGVTIRDGDFRTLA
ncbi:selenocysteine-specific translation elongation factor [Rubritalea tangerina]|uniref:Selenocysteine-specific translation elongation factor n=1 Tax=Rubritalea tangerina TaxID=430798 RepID=A0ABW4ZB53_9BACT